jgi:serine protease Do
MDLALTLGSFPDEKEPHAANVGPAEHSASGLEGVSIQTLTPQIAKQLKVSEQTKGVAVSSVSPSSSAAEAGLQEGDVVMEVNRQPVASASEFNRAITATPKDSPVLLLINRGGATTFIAIS